MDTTDSIMVDPALTLDSVLTFNDEYFEFNDDVQRRVERRRAMEEPGLTTTLTRPPFHWSFSSLCDPPPVLHYLAELGCRQSPACDTL